MGAGPVSVQKNKNQNFVVAVKAGDAETVRQALLNDPTLVNLIDENIPVFHIAVNNNNYGVVRVFLDIVPECINMVGKLHASNKEPFRSHVTALQIASTLYGGGDLIRLLVEHKADLNCLPKEIYGISPLIEAINRKDMKLLNYLIEKGVDLEKSKILKHTIKNCNVLLVKRLIDAKVDINTPKNGVTLLRKYVMKCNWGIVKVLLDSQASDNNNDIPLIVLAIKNSAPPEIFESIPRKECDLFWMDPIINDTLLHINQGGRALEWLLSNGLQVLINQENIYGKTPLITAIERRHQLVKILVKNNININAIINEETPLYHAVKSGSDIVKLLLDLNADPNLRLPNSRTPLFVSKSRLIKLLCDYKANIDIQDNEGKTPLHEAIMKKKKQSIKDLIKHGANPLIVDNEGISCFELADKIDKSLTYLIEKGRKVANNVNLSPKADDNDINLDLKVKKPILKPKVDVDIDLKVKKPIPKADIDVDIDLDFKVKKPKPKPKADIDVDIDYDLKVKKPKPNYDYDNDLVYITKPRPKPKADVDIDLKVKKPIPKPKADVDVKPKPKPKADVDIDTKVKKPNAFDHKIKVNVNDYPSEKQTMDEFNGIDEISD